MADTYGKQRREDHHLYVPITDFRKQAFLEWLCTPASEREPPYLKDIAEQLSVTRRTLTNWKVDPEFLAEWENRYRRTIGNPERVNEVMNTLYRTATDPDDPKHVQAAGKYIDIVEGVRPQKIDVTVKGGAQDLSDAQLEAIIAERAQREAEQRGLRAVNGE